jgi:arylsulfatase A
VRSQRRRRFRKSAPTPGKPRQWILVQLDGNWYVRDGRWKLNQAGELFDMKDAPFAQITAPPDSDEAKAAKARLQAVLDSLRPQTAVASPKPRQRKAKKKAAKKR